MSRQPLVRFLKIEARADAEDEVPFLPEIQIRRRTHGSRQIDDEIGHRWQEHHTHEIGARVGKIHAYPRTLWTASSTREG